MTCLTAHTSSTGGAQGKVRLVTRERPVGWGIESTRYHSLNVLSCEIFTRINRNPLVGAYLPPSTLKHLLDLEEALQRFREPIYLEDLNVDLD